MGELYQKLADYSQEIGDETGYLKALYRVRTLFKEVYGLEDKRLIKVKRQISMNLLKNEHHQEALSELLSTEEMETSLYGEYSV